MRFLLYMRQTLHHRHAYVAGTSSHLLCSTWKDLLHTPSFDTRAPTVLQYFCQFRSALKVSLSEPLQLAVSCAAATVIRWIDAPSYQG